MATSQEIAQQIADQNSWFQQQSALASQIGMDPMAFRSGGGYFSGGVPVMPQHPGMIGSPGAFNYGIRGGGFGFGNFMSRGATTMMGVTPILGTGLVEAGASAVGMSSPLTNPFAAYGMARAAGFGMAGSAGLAGLSMLPVAAAGMAMNNLVTGSRQQAMTNTALSTYNFANMQSMSGFGFSRQDGLNISSRIRQLAMLPELLTSFDEITRLLPMMQRSGVMSGVRDATEFGRRMKETIVTLRDVSKILGATMEEAGEFFAHSRRVGFLGRQAQLQNVMNAQVTMSATGMSQQQFMSMQETGASFGTAIGGSRRLGAAAVDRFATTVGLVARRDPGVIETLTNLTGKSDPGAAAADVAVQLANFGVRVAGTGPGRYLMAGLSKFGPNGEVSIDEDAMREYLTTGNRSAVERRGRQLMGSNKNIVSFERHQTRLAQQFALQGGPQAMLGLLQGSLGDDPDKAALILQQQFGASEELTDLVKAMYDMGPANLDRERQEVAQATARNAARRERSPAALWTRIKTRLRNTFLEGIRQTGAEINTKVGRFFDEMYEDFFDDTVVRMSEQTRKEYLQAFATGGAIPDVNMADFNSIPRDRSFTSMFRNTGFASFLTGEDTPDQKRRQLGRLALGDENATEAQIQTALSGLGRGENVPKSADEMAYASYLGDLRREMMRDSNFADAAPSAQTAMLSAEASKRMRGGQIWMSDAEKAASRGMYSIANRSTMDPFLVGAAAANSMEENQQNQIQLGGPEIQPIRPEDIKDARRSITEGFRRIFGEEMGAVVENDPVLQSAFERLDNLPGSVNPKAVESALNEAGAKKSAKALEAFNQLTGLNLTQGQAEKLYQARKARLEAGDRQPIKVQDPLYGGVEDEATSLGTLLKQLRSVNNAEGRANIRATAQEQAASIDVTRVDSRIANEAKAMQKALAGIADGSVTDAGEFQVATKALVQKLAGLSQEERAKALEGSPEIFKAALIRYQDSQKWLGGLRSSGKTVTGKQLAARLGVDERTIKELTGYNADQSLKITPELEAKLATAAASGASGGYLVNKGQEMTARDRENAQMVFFKTMTESLVAIAQHFNPNFNPSTKALNRYYSTVPGGGATVLPGGMVASH